MKRRATPCPCGGADYASCCGRYHSTQSAPDAETTMRARYSAYVLKLEAYLIETWHPDTRPERLDLAADHTKWLELKILRHHAESADTATVEFIARFKISGRAGKMHEISQFLRVDGRWHYLDGEFPE